MKHYDNYKSKQEDTQLLLTLLGAGYSLNEKTIKETIEMIDEMMVDTKKLKKFEEKICYYQNKIELACNLLTIKRIYKEKKYRDILLIVQYIQKQLGNIIREVDSEVGE